MSSHTWIVYKFGGSSVQGADRYRHVAHLLTRVPAETRLAVVVSAMKGVTDALIATVEAARLRDESWLTKLLALEKLHIETIETLLGPQGGRSLIEVIATDIRDLRDVLRGVWMARSASERIVELVSGYGEIWSAQILNALLSSTSVNSAWLDAREVLIVDPQERTVRIKWEDSTQRFASWLGSQTCQRLIITGYVASTSDGTPTTLKRNGSDYSASIFGALLDASEVVIWTDVDGVLSADPRRVPDAVVLDEMSYNEVAELAYFGAKVVHPATMEPAVRKGIPVWIRNTFNPDFPGTRIHLTSSSTKPVKGFSDIDGMALINVEGSGMVGVPGVAERLFSSLSRAGVSVVMISQASSEHSICFAVPEAQAEQAKACAESAFYSELHQGLIQRIDIARGCSILAVVGDNMAAQPGLAGHFFSALGRANVNVRAIAQGSSERNISAVIHSADATRALRAVHSAFYLSNQTISVGVVGLGLIGKEFLRQLQRQLSQLREERKIDIRVRGLSNSRQMLLGDPVVDLENWEARLDQDGRPADLAAFSRHLLDGHLPHAVIIDATASGDLPALYPGWVTAGLNIITPNKKASAGPLAACRELRALARKHNRYFLYSTNVGAGLPVIQTLRDLHHTGDRVLRIEGIFSGTLSYIFNTFKRDRPFSEIVKEAKARGYTEPDPREDLSGQDVARKLVILAREIGLDLELSDLAIESLVPEALRQGSIEDYLRRLPETDAAMTEKLERALERDQVLRYVGVIDENGRASVSLREFPVTHPFARVQGSDNIVAYTTQRYEHQPLVIQGPGAGPEVTAAGVFADLLRLASYLGAPL